MTSHSVTFYLLVLGIMVISGILAGLTNYFFSENQKPRVLQAILGHCLLGIAAAFTVPLFLNIISNNLLITAQKNPINLLVFNGICLIFAFVLCRFKYIAFIKPPQKTDKEEKDNTIIIPIKTDYGLETSQQEFLRNKMNLTGMTASELKILGAIANKKHGHASLVSLLKDPELINEKVNETLSSLMAEGFVEQKLNKENKLLLYLTPKGNRILEKAFG
ncbi:MAG TPA: YEATS-associated helix-containing protein [Desulfobacterales bacterium]|nr:YEATS-associated helix-containing protein [Desulfobacterales bacterium]